MKNLEKYSGIATIIGVCIALVALIPSFGAWLLPKEPTNIPTQTYLNPTHTPQQPQEIETPTNLVATQATPSKPPITSTPVTPTPVSIIEILSDVPGTPLESGTTMKSVLDKDTKPRDVYAIDLVAGQTVYVNVDNHNVAEFYYVKPGLSILDKANRVFILGPTFVPSTPSFVAATTGTYYIVALAYANGGKYEISVHIDDTTISQVTSDLPGTPLESGIKIISVLDKDTKPRDVYAIDLAAGQTVYVNVDNHNVAEFYYVKPGLSILDKANRVFILGPTFVPSTPSFVAATAGTYYLVVLAYTNGGKYELVISIE